MPALAAYLIALCLLLGGGYGALNWLATAPTVTHVVPRVKLKSNPPAYEQHSETPHAISSANALDVGAAEPKISEADDRAPVSSISRPGTTEAGGTLSGDRRVDNGDPATAQRIQSANGKLVANEVAPKSNRTFSARGKAASRPQQAARSDKRQLVLMTLRTIQFPDGRQTTQLIPYRGRTRVLAFGNQ